MFITVAMMAARESVSEATIWRVIREMEETGAYQGAIKRLGRVQIDTEMFDHYVGRRQHGGKNKVVCGERAVGDYRDYFRGNAV